MSETDPEGLPSRREATHDEAMQDGDHEEEQVREHIGCEGEPTTGRGTKSHPQLC